MPDLKPVRATPNRHILKGRYAGSTCFACIVGRSFGLSSRTACLGTWLLLPSSLARWSKHQSLPQRLSALQRCCFAPLRLQEPFRQSPSTPPMYCLRASMVTCFEFPWLKHFALLCGLQRFLRRDGCLRRPRDHRASILEHAFFWHSGTETRAAATEKRHLSQSGINRRSANTGVPIQRRNRRKSRSRWSDSQAEGTDRLLCSVCCALTLPVGPIRLLLLTVATIPCGRFT
jgi:hypothetical protein